MNPHLSMILRPSSLLILLAYGALIAVISLTPCWYVMVTRIEKRVNSNSEHIVFQFQSEIDYLSKLLQPMESSSTNLARFLSSVLDSSNISFSDIESKVGPILFQAFETLPYLAQISYIGMEGLFFSYYNDHNQALAMYSNSSISTPFTSNKTLYIQPVNRETGKLHGDATISNNPSISSSWIREKLNLSHGLASFGSNGQDLLFLNSARVTRTAVISLGYSPTVITDFASRIDQKGMSSHLITKNGKVLVEGVKFQDMQLVISNDTVSFQLVDANGDLVSNEGSVLCKDGSVASSLNIQDTQYLIQCYPIDIMGIESVYVLAVPQKDLMSFDDNYKKKGLTLLIVMISLLFIAILSFILINAKAKRREMHLCASLIKQMETVQQAERKHMNKSIAFASASHDIRTSLAGLTGLIEMSCELVDHGSELDTNLKQMHNCTQDLLGLLNSILDTSKIEAGKMQLEEEEFDVFHLLEDVVDLYHPVAMKKGVDLVLDPCNGSLIKYSLVKGDRGKLKQVFCNLLSNAVKFTEEGHIAIRAWAQKPNLKNSKITTNQRDFKKYLPYLFCNKNDEARDDIEAVNSTQQDPYCMDFTFEVDDTGKGIPKENYKSVFDNYVQVKETALGQVGTGLGLGIVQSLVHLMHGDIGIMDKNIGEKGTCFRFNVLLTSCESETVMDENVINQPQARSNHSANSSSSIYPLSPGLYIRSSSSKPEPSRVVLLIANEERQRTSQRFMESLGIKVKVVKRWKYLSCTLKKLKYKGRDSIGKSSSGSSDFNSPQSLSHNSLARAVSMGSAENNISSIFKKTNFEATPGFILIVIDTNAGPFSELYRILSNFRKDLLNPCKVVWLDKPLMRSVNVKSLDQNDIVISKPFHGSRLFQVIKLLPEYGGVWQNSSNKSKRENSYDRVGRIYRSSSLSQVSSNDENSFLNAEQIWKGTHKGEKIQQCGESSYDKPLSGKKILVVEDSALLRKLALATLNPLGASIEQCENGAQAVKLVEEGLTSEFPNSPYDYILMDCQMPVMDGLEATRRIREIEKPYGIHIPIIALTANTEKMTTKAGMDFHLVKPIKREHLLEAITYIHGEG